MSNSFPAYTDSSLDEELKSHPFDALTPSFVLNAVDHQGYISDGRILALNSYENRVYQVGIEDNEPIIAKFYRPDRWSDAQILEEHQFCAELVEQELPVVPPLEINSKTLIQYGDFRLALYPCKGGRAPELDNLDNLFIMGRFLGRMHLVGAARAFELRPAITCKHYGHESAELIKEKFIPNHIQASYDAIVDEALKVIDNIYIDGENDEYIRVHGDCHLGNILWRDDAPHFIDFDDSRMAPAIQDIWMLLSGDRTRQTAQLNEIVEGYSEFSVFPLQQIKYIESLRTLRIMYFSAWLARRWDDPAFPRAFPWFNTIQYWEQHILDLREQLGELNEPAI
ncbi:MAG: serine/threonine protein kinase, partial [Gammaproteobacteria bacterium]